MGLLHKRQGLIGLILLCVGAVVLTTHPTQAASLGCLIVNNASSGIYEPTKSVFNLDTGVMSEPLPGISGTPMSDPPVPQFDDPAPDGRHDDYLSGDNSSSPLHPIGLFIRPLDPFGPGIRVRDLLLPPGGTVKTLWSSDSKWLAYFWQDHGGSYYLGVAGIDGKEHAAIRLGSQPGDKFYFDTGFPYYKPPTDTAFVQVFKKSAGKAVVVTLYTLPDLNVQASFAAPVCSQELDPLVGVCSWWAPTGHHVAYIGWDDPAKVDTSPPSLVLYTPTTDARVTFTLNEIHVPVPDVDWSPDGQYIAIENNFTVSFSVFGLDGSASRNVAEHYHMYSCGDCSVPGPLEWSQDSRSIYYVEENPRPKPDSAMIYHVKENRLEKAIDDLQDPDAPVYSYDGHYVLSNWGQGATFTTGLIDTHTGRRVPFGKIPDGEYHQSGWLKQDTIGWTTWSDESGVHFVWMSPTDISPREVHFEGYADPLTCCYFSQDLNWLLVEISLNGSGNSFVEPWLVNLNTGASRQLASLAKAPIFSPDSRTVALISYSPDQQDNATVRVQVIRLDTGSSRQITVKAGRDAQLFFAPDSRTVALVSQDYENPVLALIPVDAGQPFVLRTTTTRIVWSPDGSMLAYVTPRNSTDDESIKLTLISRSDRQIRRYSPFPVFLLGEADGLYRNEEPYALYWLTCTN